MLKRLESFLSLFINIKWVNNNEGDKIFKLKCFKCYFDWAFLGDRERERLWFRTIRFKHELYHGTRGLFLTMCGWGRLHNSISYVMSLIIPIYNITFVILNEQLFSRRRMISRTYFKCITAQHLREMQEDPYDCCTDKSHKNCFYLKTWNRKLIHLIYLIADSDMV